MNSSRLPSSSNKINLEDIPASERAKIAAVLKKDKSQNDIGWMYNQTKDDSEAYLLGKAVSDAEHIEKLGRDYEESSSQRLSRIDMETKYREDPLTIMKQRETEKRMELLKNTAKIKKLRRLLTIQKHQKEHGRKRKKSKKHKHHRRSRSPSSSSSSSSGDELLEKFIKIVRQCDEKNSLDENKDSNSKRPSSPESDEPRHKQPPQRRPDRVDIRRHDRPAREETKDRPKLSREEIESRRAQMMQDAKEYNKVRSIRTSRHIEELTAESAREAVNRHHHGASFITDLKISHAQRSTIEDGVHRTASRRQKDDGRSHLLSR